MKSSSSFAGVVRVLSRSGPSVSRATVRLALALAALALAAPAQANGRYPAAGQIAIHPTNPDVLLVRATYGLLFTTNGGQSWSWICEPAVGYGGVEDPMMAFTADGTLLAGVFEGLSIGQPDGCNWSFAPGGLANKYVIDLAADKVHPENSVLIISNHVGQSDAGAPIVLTQLWQTSDSGKTWAQSGVNLPPGFLGLTVDTAASNPNRIYLSGRNGPPDYLGVVERSDDRRTLVLECRRRGAVACGRGRSARRTGADATFSLAVREQHSEARPRPSRSRRQPLRTRRRRRCSSWIVRRSPLLGPRPGRVLPPRCFEGSTLP
jgi:hypothetical protein